MFHAPRFLRLALPVAGLIVLAGCGSSSTGTSAQEEETFADDAGETPIPAKTETKPKVDTGTPPVNQPSLDAGAPSSADGGIKGDGGVSEGGSADGGAVCANLVNDAPLVVSERVSGNVPNTTGGAMKPGTYFLTSARFYNGSNAEEQKLSRKLVIKAIQGQPNILSFESINESKQTFAGTYKLFNRDLDRVINCPAEPGVDELGYTASGSTLTIAFFGSGVTFTYTKQP